MALVFESNAKCVRFAVGILTDNRQDVGGDAGVEGGRVRRHLAGEVPRQIEAHVAQGDVCRVGNCHLEERIG